MAANWAPLRRLLDGADMLTLEWGQLDALVGGLPESATKHSAFWSGARSGWPGFRTVDVVVGKSVTFVRFSGAPARRSATRAVTPSSGAATQPARSPGAADLVLVGCVKQKLDHPAAARDLYISPLFAKERAYAEASGAPWFILSAEHGLVAPDEVLAPYDLRLSKTPSEYRRAWGIRVVNRLGEVAGPLNGKRIEVHAGSAYIDPIRPLLTQHGAYVVEPFAGLKLGPRLAWYKNGAPSPVPIAPNNAEASPVAPDVAEYVRILEDEATARTPTEFLATNGVGLRSPGLYSWWVDPAGAADLTRSLRHVIRPGMIYAGLAGATRERSGRQSSNTLWLRISGMHLGGKHEFSTLRLTLGSTLVGALGWSEIDEAKLSEWMHAHLRVITLPVADADTLGKLESAVLEELDPPLNLSKVAKTDIRRRLSELRRQYSRKRRRSDRTAQPAD